VLANVVLPDSIERDHGAVIVDLFAEAVRQSREAAHRIVRFWRSAYDVLTSARFGSPKIFRLRVPVQTAGL